ncbi:MAG: hypothetical protein JL50_00200 [Peptococcaceae bacterium BICA1-7]|nr:MAG: hypothetical protein JL50_00200 [Peptococcaceae bacterium BICA1-7]HBV98195.1 sensor histidine kinase [Desulfotomaculum sp.]
MKVLRSLRTRLIFSFVALALLLLTFSGYIFSNALSMYAISVQRSQQALYLKQAVSVLEEAQMRNLSGEEILALLRKDFPDVRIEVETAMLGKEGVTDGLKIYFSPGKTALPDGRVMVKPTFPVEATPLAAGKIGGILYTSRPGESSFSLPAVTESRGGSSITTYRFTLSPSSGSVLSNLYRQVLEVLVLALGLAVLIGWLLSQWLARPLSRLVAATEAVAGGNFLGKVERSGISELDRLGDHFNRMVLYLRESFRSLAAERDTARRFASDAAHELKTPVATLRAYNDVLTERPERLQQVSPIIGRQIERMEQVITGLLQIANLAEGSDTALEPTDLCEEMRRLEPRYQALAEESGLRLTTACPQNTVQAPVSQHLLELALDNLMDNACKYTEPGGEVGLTLQVDGNEAVFMVRDSGPGIAPEEIPYIFDRFHRGVDTQSIPGTGLGLAIAQEAVKRMGGTLAAESKPGHGSLFSIRLPLLM